jgi:hypothetical protein
VGFATGLGLLDTAVVQMLNAELGPRSGYCRSDLLTRWLFERSGEDPVDGYHALTMLSQPWFTNLNLVDGNGNFGSPGNDSPADGRYTECRLSAAGAAAAAAEDGTGPPLPFGLVLGSTFRGGARPPFDPICVADAVEAVAAGEDPHRAAHRLGLPAFPGGAVLTEELFGREAVQLRAALPAVFRVEALLRRGLGETYPGPVSRECIDTDGLPGGRTVRRVQCTHRSAGADHADA